MADQVFFAPARFTLTLLPICNIFSITGAFLGGISLPPAGLRDYPHFRSLF